MDELSLLKDPMKFVSFCWPQILLYDKQVDILYSLRDNDETVVYAGNKLGKDFIAALAVIWFFASRTPCRIITSSAGQSQLRSVLWGEMSNFLMTSLYPFPFTVNDLLLRKETSPGILDPKSYVRGIVTNAPENLQGHHLAEGPNEEPRTLALFDEASGINDEFNDAVETWAHRKLIIGNPLPCSNFFFRSSKDGDIKKEIGNGLHTKVIQIKGSDSPNVRFAESQIGKGKKPTGKNIIDGVLTYNEYMKRRKLWDPVRQCIGLDAEFYTGVEVLLFPPDWLNKGEEAHREIIRALLKIKRKNKKFVRKGKALGIDTAEGGDNTVWTVVDTKGIIAQYTESTTDTSVIPNKTIALMNQHGISHLNTVFDSGGGGKQHADILRRQGYEVRNVSFASSPTPPEDEGDFSSAYVNLRAEMYHKASLLFNPSREEQGDTVFGISPNLRELRRQLAVMPLLYDQEGRIYLPPKSKPSDNYKGETIQGMIGCSPDEADSFVLGVYGLQHPITEFIATAS